ncbi:shikimate kinase [Propionimicrobium sp. PCR01-08-3]|uniref:shikimate kinase n=1 Tax=Propionimicrobium sp. PCR01-08-3 TaxID=3052086 RepID=UPI00255CCC0B|nr:shikimate kinase [Propionimicrobium sp. PCR01-08-3]WIY83893.1 shikimate kinase [Propionimicrobium sp. PCR01-08-3]
MTEQPAIVLVGPPAVGKSTVGALLAAQLGVRFCDVDKAIERAERRPITEIFAERGEVGFRQLEFDATLAALEAGGVVALGGGAVTNTGLRTMLADYPVVWLRATVREAVRRVGASTTRPLLNGDVAGNWKKLVAGRRHYYEQVATLAVDTAGRSPGQVVTDIVTALERADRP